MEMIIPKKILVIDDEPGICDIVCLNLESEGYQTDCAQSGQDALIKVRAANPDAIILDIMMPGVDGWEVLSHIKNNPASRDIPVILLSAKGEEISKLLGFQLGADDYITKPFSVKELTARVKVVLDRYGAKQAETRQAASSPDGNKIMAHKGREIFFVDISSIFFAAADKNYTYLHTNDDKYVLRRNISQVENQLPRNFMRVHKSFIVNLTKVSKLFSLKRGSYLVELTDARRSRIPVSRSKLVQLRRAISGRPAP